MRNQVAGLQRAAGAREALGFVGQSSFGAMWNAVGT
jgi:hypothetical protein